MVQTSTSPFYLFAPPPPHKALPPRGPEFWALLRLFLTGFCGPRCLQNISLQRRARPINTKFSSLFLHLKLAQPNIHSPTPTQSTPRALPKDHLCNPLLSRSNHTQLPGEVGTLVWVLSSMQHVLPTLKFLLYSSWPIR